MFIKKIKIVILYLSFLIILNGCIQSTSSLFGPSITIAKTGNIYQGGASLVSNQIMAKKFGKPPIELIEDLFTKNPTIDKSNGLVTKKNNFKNIVSLVNEKNNEQEHSDFVNAVKKVLE